MNEIFQASFISQYNPEGQWIQVLPAGSWMGHDGRGPFRLSDPQSVISASLRAKTDLRIDRDHEAFFAKPGTPVKAAGWMKELEVRNGEIWAFVEWTPAAQNELAAKEYRYFSPEYTVDKTSGEITGIIGGSLTNDPNFELMAVASAQRNPTTQQEKKTMDEHLKKLAASLGLSETATTEEIQAASQKKFDELSKLSGDYEKLKEKAETASQEKPDPSEYVPMSAHTEVASQLKALQETVTQDKAEAVVEAAMSEGKIVPAQKDWAIDYATRDLEGFQSFLKGQPKIISDAASASSQEPDADKPVLSDADKEVASQLGISEEQMAGTQKKEDKAA